MARGAVTDTERMDLLEKIAEAAGGEALLFRLVPGRGVRATLDYLASIGPADYSTGMTNYDITSEEGRVRFEKDWDRKRRQGQQSRKDEN